MIAHIIDLIVRVIVILGAINWGLIGVFNVDLVAAIFGKSTILSRIVYVIIGAAGVWLAYSFLSR